MDDPHFCPDNKSRGGDLTNLLNNLFLYYQQNQRGPKLLWATFSELTLSLQGEPLWLFLTSSTVTRWWVRQKPGQRWNFFSGTWAAM